MKFSSILIGILLLGAIFGGFYTFTNSIITENNYDTDFGIVTDSKYQNSFDKIEEISNKTSAAYVTMYGNDETNETGWAVDKLSYLGFVPDALSLIKDIVTLPFSLAGDFIFSIGIYLGVPSWVTALLLAVTLVILLFALLQIILRYKYT
jgi:hypothetical protein